MLQNEHVNLHHPLISAHTSNLWLQTVLSSQPLRHWNQQQNPTDPSSASVVDFAVAVDVDVDVAVDMDVAVDIDVVVAVAAAVVADVENTAADFASYSSAHTEAEEPLTEMQGLHSFPHLDQHQDPAGIFL